ncbi:WSC-domain-containing protein, partial [Lophium mytilinum]
AVSSTTGTAASASASATVYPEAGTYKYAGCYNETTGYKENGGARALSAGGWTMEGQDDMTPDMCLSFCDGMNYAGLEYGRECWCSYSLSTLSKKLDEKKCDMPCAGDGAKFCGG